LDRYYSEIEAADGLRRFRTALRKWFDFAGTPGRPRRGNALKFLGRFLRAFPVTPSANQADLDELNSLLEVADRPSREANGGQVWAPMPRVPLDREGLIQLRSLAGLYQMIRPHFRRRTNVRTGAGVDRG
jgi:hypothetical protein